MLWQEGTRIVKGVISERVAYERIDNAAYHPERLKNNETKAELLMRSKYLLMVSPEKWTPSQRERAEMLLNCILT